MNKLFQLVIAFAAFSFCPFVHAQLSNVGHFVGIAPAVGDVYFEIQGPTIARIYYFDYTFGVSDFASLTISGSQASGVSINGRNVAVTFSSTAFSGSIAGVAFSGSRQSEVGGRRIESLTGTLFDTVTAGGFISRVIVLPDSRIVFFYITNVGVFGGIGTMSATRAANVRVTSGRTWSFNLNVSETGIASGSATVTGAAPIGYLFVPQAGPTLINIATRGTVGGGNALSAGFVITGAKTLLIRGVGPTLGAFGVPNAQTDPAITLYSGQTVLATNNDWSGATISMAASQVGAFALQANSRDAAMIVTLESGAYTVQVTGAGPAGDALVEVYEIN